MNYIRNHIPRNTPKKRRPGIKMTPTTITIHSTGNPSSTAKNERNWLTNPSNTRQASWHICVDEKEVIEAIPLNEIAYHAGSASGNSTSIGIEICESGDRQKTLNNAIKLTAKLLKERNWGIDKLKRHYDWSKKICPRILHSNNWQGWNDFVWKVGKELGNMSNEPSAWAKQAWVWAEKQGLLDGTRPKDNITREEMALVIKRLVERLVERV